MSLLSLADDVAHADTVFVLRCVVLYFVVLYWISYVVATINSGNTLLISVSVV